MGLNGLSTEETITTESPVQQVQWMKPEQLIHVEVLTQVFTWGLIITPSYTIITDYGFARGIYNATHVYARSRLIHA